MNQQNKYSYRIKFNIVKFKASKYIKFKSLKCKSITFEYNSIKIHLFSEICKILKTDTHVKVVMRQLLRQFFES